MSERHAQRTDPHRPGAIIPAHYRLRVSYALASVVEGWPCPPLNVDMVLALMSEQKFARTGGIGKCSVCGANFLQGDVWVHEPSGEHIHIGHECARKYELLADRSEFELERGRQKEATAREVQKHENAERLRALFAAHPGLEEAFALDHPIARDIASRYGQYNPRHGRYLGRSGPREISDKQIALMLKLVADAKRPPEEKESLVPAPIAAGRTTFRGTVISAKTLEGQFGESYKMTVKVATPAGAWLAWGTVPSALLESVPCGVRGRLQNLRGCEVEITATLQPGREPHFALMKRPIGVVVTLSEQAQADQQQHAAIAPQEA